MNMNDKPYNDVKSYLIGLQQSTSLTQYNTLNMPLVFEHMQRATHESQEISSFLKGLRDGLIWFNESGLEDRDDYLHKCSIVLEQIIGKCFD